MPEEDPHAHPRNDGPTAAPAVTSPAPQSAVTTGASALAPALAAAAPAASSDVTAVVPPAVPAPESGPVGEPARPSEGGPASSPRTTEVIDLERAAEARGKQLALAYVREVRDLCRLAGRADLADEFLAREAPVDAVRTALLEARARQDEAFSIATGHDGVTATPSSVDLAEVSRDAYARLGRAAGA